MARRNTEAKINVRLIRESERRCAGFGDIEVVESCSRFAVQREVVPKMAVGKRSRVFISAPMHHVLDSNITLALAFE